MLKKGISQKLWVKQKDAVVGTFLVGNAFVWYLCAFRFLQDAAGSEGFTGNSLILVLAVNFFGVALSAFFVSSYGRFKMRLAFLKYWVLTGIMLSLVFLFINLPGFVSLIIVAAVVGVYFGIGMPTCLGYYTAATEPQNRAKLSGIIVLLIGLGFPFLSSVGTSEAILTAAALSIWLVSAFVFVVLIRPAEKKAEREDSGSYLSVISNKPFLRYVVPWLMFSLVNDLTVQINTKYFTSSGFPLFFAQNFILIENVLAGISAVACGVLADRKGRKRLALVSFALLGVGYASLGLFSGNYFTAWFYVCVDGVAWGAFSMLFLFTVWGDIAQRKNGEKYYILGILPYMLSTFAGLSMGTYISANLLESTVFSFASFFLFVAILPLNSAPETLSQKIIRDIDLNSYVNKAIQKAKKENAKKPETYRR